MKQGTLLFRIFWVFIAMMGFLIVATAKLYDLQIVNGEVYAAMAESRLSSNNPIYAARGEIVDRNGVKLVSNSMALEVSFNMSTWNIDEQNNVVLRLVTLFDELGNDYNTTFPIKLSENDEFEFFATTQKLFDFLESKKADSSIQSPNEIIEYMRSRYKISSETTNKDALSVIKIRYEMEQMSFSTVTDFVFASDVSDEIVAVIKERSEYFTGVVVDVKPIREYQTEYAAHILGRVGAIQNYDEYKSLGYKMNATVGIDGMEKYLEPYIMSVDGKKSVDLVIDGEVVANGLQTDPIPGNNAMLTIDLNLQQVAEESLARTIEEIKANAILYNRASGQDAQGGAVVVLDVNTSEVLALASYPTYSLETFSQDYNELSQDESRPMYNRAISGLYAPGSTYKMVTSIAALEEGIITTDTIINATGIYTRYAPSYTPACWIYNQNGGSHGRITVADALKVSCNYFMYDIGRLLTGETQAEYAEMFGLGSKTGIELAGESTGVVAGPKTRVSAGGVWYPGDSLSSAIGQSDHLYTPVQLANYVAAIANGGTVNQVHLLKQIQSYDNTEIVYVPEVEILSEISIDDENLIAIFEGMNNVVNEGGTAASVFRNYPIDITAKTGTAEVPNGSSNGLFVSFAPYENPEIAVCVVGEHVGSGGNLGAVVRDIYDEYFGLYKTE